MSWTPITVTVETPMFLNGAEGRTEFRIPALRGAARFWFRVLAAPVFGDDFRRVADAEADIFGTAADDTRDSQVRRGPSRVVFRPRTLPEPVVTHRVGENLRPAWLALSNDQPRKGVAYLLGVGLFKPPVAISRPSYFEPGATGRFEIRADSPDIAEIGGICLWATATFGGLGARTSRGFGGIRLDGLEKLSDTTSAAGPLDVSHPAVRRLQHLVKERYKPTLSDPLATPDTNGYPEAPSASRWDVRRAPKNDSWVQILDAVGQELRKFRAPVDRTQKPYFETGLPAYRQFATREYLEIIRNGQPPDPATFAIGAFGLPVVFAHGAVVDLVEANGSPLRRASPLWLRTIPAKGGRRDLLCHVFESKIGPEWGHLALKINGQPSGPHLVLDETTAYSTIGAFVDRVAPLSQATTT